MYHYIHSQYSILFHITLSLFRNKNSLKSNFLLDSSNTRRKKLLEEQKNRRRNQLLLTRQILGLEDGVLDTNQAVREQDVEKKIEESSSMSVENSDNSMETSLSKEEKEKRRNEQLKNHYLKRRDWCSTLQYPEWMISVPEDLFDTSSTESGWYVTSRLEGTRVILYTKNHRTYLRDTNGNFIASCSSTFPGDKVKGAGVVLDCIYSPSTSICYVYDIYRWNNLYFSDNSFHYRYFFLLSKVYFQEMNISLFIQKKRYSIQPASFYDCTPQNLYSCYSMPTAYEKNGLLFIHKSSQIETGLSPLILQWKDANICKYLINTDRYGNIPEKQVISLIYRQGQCFTQEQVCLLSLEPSQVQEYNLEDDVILNIEISSIQFNNEQCTLMDPTIVNKCGYKKVLPDSLSKILFQYSLRTKPLTMEQILNSSKEQDISME